MTTNKKFTDSITDPSDVAIIEAFVDFLYVLEIIDLKEVEDFDNHLHDELSICPDCEHFNDECDCHDGRYNREYDDEASFE